MSKVYGYHQGDRSEYLGRYLLSALGHTVMVERPADYFGVDMYLKLADLTDGRGQVLRLNGMECAIQFKSDYQMIPVDTVDARTALYDLRQPFFICVVDKETKTIRLFQTLGRFNSYWNDPNKHVGIVLGNHRDGFPFAAERFDDLNLPTAHGNLKERLEALKGYIYCGDPIVTIGLEKIFTPQGIDDVLRSSAKTLTEWIELDNQAIVMKILGLPASASRRVDKNDATEKNLPGLFMENPTAEQLGLLLNCMGALARLTAECFDLRLKHAAPGNPTIEDMEQVTEYMREFANRVYSDRKQLFPTVDGSLFHFYLPGESAMLESRNLPPEQPTDDVHE